jgi:cullin 1
MILYITQTLKNQALISEVTSQVSTRFTPKISDIKRAIESLLDKEYLERMEDQRDVSAAKLMTS